jgi:hypothetical protein
VSREAISDQVVAAWLNEFARLEERGAHFFSINPVLAGAVKVA